MTPSGPDIYATRFDDRDAQAKDLVWTQIVRYLQRYVDDGSPLLDVACDRGYFVRHVVASERWATDIRDMSASLPADVRFVQSSGLELTSVLPTAYFGTVFMSNYLEHLGSSDEVVQQLRVAAELLKPGGRLMVLQPNIRLVGQRYWDFIDHRVALTEQSLQEASELAGLRTSQLVTRFIPYSTKGRLPTSGSLTRAYLSVPLLWRFMGKQTLLVSTRPS